MNMKNIFKTMLIMNSLLLAAPGIFAQALANQKTMYVLKADSIKQKASMFGKTIYVSKLGESLFVLEEKGAWTKVQVPSSGEVGWIKSKNLTSKKVRENNNSADADEIALAGKGQEITNEVIMKPADGMGTLAVGEEVSEDDTKKSKKRSKKKSKNTELN